ncbi:MAG: ABC transporter ATP-binding protein [Eubacteriales bacterium]|nr:ABC transporter ATP-binding protein [Eubacteriales bacterium]MDD3882276.1 ABC transporter ATP-binding protein [Eubacteriales bacterium]MDD4512022.1 ABC transporter ATP-binding protein [Eubacteriales bacterium]
MIALERVSKRYGSLYAVRDLSFRIDSGEIAGLLGRNGAGKTTTLNIITGYTAPASGDVSVGGHDLMLEPREARRLIGYLPEKPPLYDEMTVNDYLAFVCRLREVSESAIKKHIDEITERTGITGERKRLIGNLSKGYRQRVGMAGAICGNPQVLILDEPTVGLDPKQVVEMRELIRSLGREHTVLISSHILSEIQAICDRVIILSNGRIVLNQRKDDEPKYALTACVQGRRDVLIQRVGALPQVKSVSGEQLGEGATRLEIEYREGCDIYRVLGRLFVALDMPLISLASQATSLEETFLRVTASEEEKP